jgi:outer membrane lipoprotein carrier protein
MPRCLRYARYAVLIPLLFAVHTAAAETVQQALKRFSDNVKTFEAHFEQVQTDEHGQVTSRSSGHFWLSRPGRFRWVYEQPYEQITVCDGDKLWSYDPDLAQVTVRKARLALAGTPAALLSQKTSLTDAFKVQEAGIDDDGNHRVRLVPKSNDSDFKSIDLVLDKEGAPRSMEFADQIGGHSLISFTDAHTNTDIPAAQFHFEPPKGVEVVDTDAEPAH